MQSAQKDSGLDGNGRVSSRDSFSLKQTSRFQLGKICCAEVLQRAWPGHEASLAGTSERQAIRSLWDQCGDIVVRREVVSFVKIEPSRT